MIKVYFWRYLNYSVEDLRDAPAAGCGAAGQVSLAAFIKEATIMPHISRVRRFIIFKKPCSRRKQKVQLLEQKKTRFPTLEVNFKN